MFEKAEMFERSNRRMTMGNFFAQQAIDRLIHPPQPEMQQDIDAVYAHMKDLPDEAISAFCKVVYKYERRLQDAKSSRDMMINMLQQKTDQFEESLASKEFKTRVELNALSDQIQDLQTKFNKLAKKYEINK